MVPHRQLGLVLFALLALGLPHAAPPAAAQPAAASPSLAPEMALGDPKAKVTVIEYASASCPHCARFNNETFPEFKKKYIDTGKVHYIFREILTEPVAFAGTAFLMARCDGGKNYFPILSEVFQEQDDIYKSGDLPAGLLKIGAKYGMTKDRINACMDQAAIKALDARLADADKAGVESTPTFVIGKTKLEGERTLDELSAVIDPLLAA